MVFVVAPEQSHEWAPPPLQGESRDSDVCDWTEGGQMRAGLMVSKPSIPHPPPGLPLEGGGDARSIHASVVGILWALKGLNLPDLAVWA